jgi:glyoxylase-like metal-dependent hydrolase (beta-lactamase superfamily II)
LKLTAIQAGYFKLDGGAMFGVVPKVLWNKLNPSDSNNLCTWTMRCLLLELESRVILFDTGMGNKQGDKFKSHFHPSGTTDIEIALKEHGYQAADITDVFLTHLHFDHVGGAVKFNTKGDLVPTFPNATYWSDKQHYEWALKPNDRERASFLKENFVPLLEQGVLQFIDVEQHANWLDQIKIKYCYGHTHRMLVPMIKLPNGKTMLYCADLLPSRYHISMPYVMSYDIRPLETLKEKQLFLEQAADEGHILFLEHDPEEACCTVKRNEKGRIVLDKAFSLESVPLA